MDAHSKNVALAAVDRAKDILRRLVEPPQHLHLLVLAQILPYLAQDWHDKHTVGEQCTTSNGRR